MVPTFRYMGGKARLRNWLMSHFPNSGRCYIEPFVGVGNVFFGVRNKGGFEAYYLNDKYCNFLPALLEANLTELPKTVTKEDFSKWKESSSAIARLIEPRITFGGKGYAHGYSGTSGTHVGYDGDNYLKVCESAQSLLLGASLHSFDFTFWLEWEELNDLDFMYCDPPYFGTKGSYPNIDHEKLVDGLNKASFKWALSGYDNEIYATYLRFSNRYTIERNSEIKSSNTRKRTPVVEVLWTNY